MDGYVLTLRKGDTTVDYELINQSLCSQPHHGRTYLGTRPQEHSRIIYGLSHDGL
jgi:hypothetical protein